MLWYDRLRGRVWGENVSDGMVCVRGTLRGQVTEITRANVLAKAESYQRCPPYEESILKLICGLGVEPIVRGVRACTLSLVHVWCGCVVTSGL